MKTLRNIILGCTLLLAALLLGAFISGGKARAYKTLTASDTVLIKGKKQTIENLATLYKPKMYIRPNTPSPPLKWIWYEACPNDSTVDITYHFTWENEINPSKILYCFYSVFRRAYYGSPLYDIEYFQVNVNRYTGLVQKVRFETSKDDYYYPQFVKHIRVRFDKASDGSYYESIIDSKEDKELTYPVFDSLRIKAGVETWNHLTRLLDDRLTSLYSVQLDAPLKFLSDSDYVKYKFARKSQGDYQTK